MRLLEKINISILRKRYDFIIGWGAAENEFARCCNIPMYQMDYMIDGGMVGGGEIGSVICGYEIQEKGILKSISESCNNKILFVIFPNLEEEIEIQIREYLTEFDTIVARLVDFEKPILPRSYSDAYEDLVILDLLKKLDITNPSYIDLGVCHPVIRNNTYMFYEAGYTNGILIEPNVDMCRLISDYRPKNKLLQMGVTGDIREGNMRYYMSYNKSYRGHNTFMKDVAERQGFSDNFKDIPVYNINRIISENCEKTPDFLDIDVEGMDYEILKGLDLNKFRFKIICIETWKDMGGKIKELFKVNKYVHYMSLGENSIYVAAEIYEDRLKQKNSQ